MKPKLESKINEETTFFQRFKHGVEKVIAGATLVTFLATSAIGCASLKHYIEPKLGLIAPVAAKEQAYSPSFLIGGAYGVNIGKVGLEVGVDYFKSSKKYTDPIIATIETNSILPRVNASYYPLEQSLEPTVKIKPYLMAGVNFLSESSIIDIPEFDVHDEVKNSTFGLEFGVGATIFDGLHARLSYTVLPASENVRGMFTGTLGYRLLFGEKQ